MNNYNINCIAGFKKEKEELIKIIDFLNDNSNLNSKGGYIPKGLIFYGEPGNGKTLFSKVLSNETYFDFFEVNITDGNFSSNLKRTFKKALKKEKAIIFVDELNRVIANSIHDETDETRKNITTLLSLIDGYKTKENNTIFFVATANDYEDLPEALTRPGRIDKKIYISNPTNESRKEILNYYINKTDCKFDIDMNRMIELTKNFSSAGLKTLVNECVLETDDNNLINEKLFTKKVNEIINENIVNELSKEDDCVIAFKELGKFVIANHYFTGDYILNINNNGSSSGELFDSMNEAISRCDDNNDDEYYDEDDDNEKESNNTKSFISKKNLLETVQVLMGGIIANTKLNNGPYSIDIESYTNIRNIIDYGFYCGFFGYQYTFSYDAYSDKISNEKLLKREKILEDILNEQYSIAENIIESNKHIITSLVNKLVKGRVLDKCQVDKILMK